MRELEICETFVYGTVGGLIVAALDSKVSSTTAVAVAAGSGMVAAALLVRCVRRGLTSGLWLKPHVYWICFTNNFPFQCTSPQRALLKCERVHTFPTPAPVRCADCEGVGLVPATLALMPSPATEICAIRNYTRERGLSLLVYTSAFRHSLNTDMFRAVLPPRKKELGSKPRHRAEDFHAPQFLRRNELGVSQLSCDECGGGHPAHICAGRV
eukprot:5993864-Pleurochrysis_carterae.AAC.1